MSRRSPSARVSALTNRGKPSTVSLRYLPSPNKGLVLAFAVAISAAFRVEAAEYPQRPIRLIISSAVGGSPDIVTRILAAELVKQMGQQIIVDNRPGAAQTIGTEMVVRATPDGYTIGYANVVTLAINKSLLPKQPYDPDKDLVIEIGRAHV